MGDVVRVERPTEAVGMIRIDRPKVNAINAEVVSDLVEACAEVAADDAIRAAVVYGGERAFSAGADLNEMTQGTASEIVGRVRDLQRACDRLAELSVVTVAAVNGFALGGGCEIALACDFRVASRQARLGQPEIVVGLIPGAGGTQRLPRLIGPARAKHMIYSGDFVESEQANVWGLVDEVTDGDALDRAIEIATRYADGPTVSLAQAKRAIDRGLDGPIATGLEAEIQAFGNLFSTRDTRHGLESFAAEGPGKARFEGR